MRRTYPTDLSDAEWSCLEPYLPAPKSTGRPRVYPLREILNAVFYVVRSGCSWRLLPHDLPPWRSVYHYFREFRLDGTWERMHAALRERLRIRLNRNPQPSAGIVDSQSVKTTGVGGEQRGYDGGKKVKGRKPVFWSPFMSSLLCPYPSDLSDQEWEILAPLIPPAKPGGRPRKWPMRKILNAIFYLLRSGCQWRMLPREFPPWSTVHDYFRLWRLDGTWERISAVLRGQRLRVRVGRDPQPQAPGYWIPNL